MSVNGYEDLQEQHYWECEECQTGRYAKIEDCPAFKSWMEKLEGLAEMEYQRQKEDELDSN